jgi:hypothetical protein
MVRGPESASVYWRRRAIVAGVIAALVLAVVVVLRLLASGGEDEPMSFSIPSPTGDVKRPYISPTPAAPEPESESGEPDEPSVEACDDGDLMLQVVAAFAEVRSGTAVPLSVLVASGADETCTAEVGAVAVEVTAGSDVVYSTAHCERRDAEEVELDAGDGRTVEFVFDGRASDDGCAGDRRRLPAGEYELRARLGEAVSPPAALRLN